MISDIFEWIWVLLTLPTLHRLQQLLVSRIRATEPVRVASMGCKRATREGLSAHPSLRRSGLIYRARTCGFPSQKLFPAACPILWGHGCRWKRKRFCGGTPSLWPPWAKHLEGKLCWSCGHLPTHTWWSNTSSLAFNGCFNHVDPGKRFSLVFTPFEMALSFLPATGHQLPGVYGRHVKLSDNIRGNCLKPCLCPLLSGRCPRVRSCAQPVVECLFFLVALAEMLSLLNSMAGRAVVNKAELYSPPSSIYVKCCATARKASGWLTHYCHDASETLSANYVANKILQHMGHTVPFPSFCLQPQERTWFKEQDI